MTIPLSEPDITDAEIDEVVAVLRSSRLSLGPKMEEFEAMVSAYAGTRHGIAVSSGTAGLHMCLRAFEIGPGDEVIVPSFTFIAAANAIRYVGATPVFVDVRRDSLNLDAALVEAAITPRTRAILVVHTFGVPAEMKTLLALAARHKLRVLEDACEALGAESHGQRVGSFGDAAVFAFYPNKQITTGEGGMIVTGDDALAGTLRALRNQGRFPTDDWHQHTVLGYNYRLSELHCALGCAQMRRIDGILAARDRVARSYEGALACLCAELDRPVVDLPATRISWFVYVIRLAERHTQQQRDAVVEVMASRGITCGRYFAPIHQQAAYADLPAPGPLPVTESVSQRTVALPFFNRLDQGRIDQVAEALRQAIETVTSSIAARP